MKLCRLWTLLGVASIVLMTAQAVAQDDPPAAGQDEVMLAGPEEAQEGAAPNEKTEGATEGEGEKAPKQEEKPQGIDWKFPLLMIGVFVLLYFWMGRSRRKTEAKRRDMLAALKKGDKVTSVGGIVGTVIEVREDELVVKVDETNNVRMRFARWAVRGVGDQAKTEPPEDRK